MTCVTCAVIVFSFFISHQKSKTIRRNFHDNIIPNKLFLKPSSEQGLSCVLLFGRPTAIYEGYKILSLTIQLHGCLINTSKVAYFPDHILFLWVGLPSGKPRCDRSRSPRVQASVSDQSLTLT